MSASLMIVCASSDACIRASWTSAGSGGGPNNCSRSRSATTEMSPNTAACVAGALLITLDNELLLAAARNHYLARVLEPADDRDDPLLRLFDAAQANGAHKLHVFSKHVRSALGHVLEDARLHV